MLGEDIVTPLEHWSDGVLEKKVHGAGYTVHGSEAGQLIGCTPLAFNLGLLLQHSVLLVLYSIHFTFFVFSLFRAFAVAFPVLLITVHWSLTTGL